MGSDTVSTFGVCSSNGGSKTSPALCQWSEVMNHPGLVCCVQQTTGVPLVVMVKPDTFLIQEIKTLPAKAKVSALFPGFPAYESGPSLAVGKEFSISVWWHKAIILALGRQAYAPC